MKGFTVEEASQQNFDLALLERVVAIQGEVFKHIGALVGLADKIAEGIDVMRSSGEDIAIAEGAYPDEVQSAEAGIAESAYMLEATVRAYATHLAQRYGIDA